MNMYCPECGNQNPETAKFCMKCGYNYRQATVTENSSEYKSVSSSQSSYTGSLPNNSTDSAKPIKKNSNVSLFTVLVLLIGGGILVFVYVANVDKNNLRTDNAQNFTSSVPQSEGRQQSVDIVNQSFSLKAGEFVSYKFSIPKEVSSGQITGTFTASGGSNDIYVLVTNETGLTNFKSGNQGKAYYNSGKVTTDDLNINLTSGKYYIIFSNSHSMLTPKAINADIKLTF